MHAVTWPFRCGHAQRQDAAPARYVSFRLTQGVLVLSCSLSSRLCLVRSLESSPLPLQANTEGFVKACRTPLLLLQSDQSQHLFLLFGCCFVSTAARATMQPFPFATDLHLVAVFVCVICRPCQCYFCFFFISRLFFRLLYISARFRPCLAC